MAESDRGEQPGRCDAAEAGDPLRAETDAPARQLYHRGDPADAETAKQQPVDAGAAAELVARDQRQQREIQAGAERVAARTNQRRAGVVRSQRVAKAAD